MLFLSSTFFNSVTFLVFSHLVIELIFSGVHVLINLIHSTKRCWGILFCALDYVFFKSEGFIIPLRAMFLSFKGWLVLFVFIWERCLSMFGYLSLFCSPQPCSIRTFSLFWPSVRDFSLTPCPLTLTCLHTELWFENLVLNTTHFPVGTGGEDYVTCVN